MKWPWMNREDAEAILDVSHEHQSALIEQVRALQHKYDELLASHLAYLVPSKTEGTSALPQPFVPAVKSLIATTIREQAAGDTRLAAFLWQRARDLKQQGKSEEVIAMELQEWDTTEPAE